MTNKAILFKKEEFIKLHKAGELAAQTLDYITPYVKVGVKTKDIDSLLNEFILSHGAKNAITGYRGYPGNSCISINHVICHGIPSDKKLQEGDIANIDITLILDGYYADTSRMYAVGKVGVKGRRLIDTTYECMMAGIEVVKPGATIGDIGYAIEKIAHQEKFSVVRDFCGHGTGREFHTYPNVLHYGRPGEGVVLQEGMVFTIEPMINTGTYAAKILSDDWTAVTRDRGLSAQFEHTIGVTSTGYEIFTSSPKGWHKPPYD